MPMSDFNPPADVVTEIANLREDCAASGAEIARLRDEVAGLTLEGTVLKHALAQVVAFTQGQRRRGNTYRRRALCLVRQVDEERTWALFYRDEAARVRRELDALRARVEMLCTSVDVNTIACGPTTTVELATVADWLAALSPCGDSFTAAELEQIVHAAVES